MNAKQLALGFAAAVGTTYAAGKLVDKYRIGGEGFGGVVLIAIVGTLTVRHFHPGAGGFQPLHALVNTAAGLAAFKAAQTVNRSLQGKPGAIASA